MAQLDTKSNQTEEKSWVFPQKCHNLFKLTAKSTDTDSSSEDTGMMTKRLADKNKTQEHANKNGKTQNNNILISIKTKL